MFAIAFEYIMYYGKERKEEAIDYSPRHRNCHRQMKRLYFPQILLHTYILATHMYTLKITCYLHIGINAHAYTYYKYTLTYTYKCIHTHTYMHTSMYIDIHVYT